MYARGGACFSHMWHLRPGPGSCLAVVLFLLPLPICHIPCPSVFSLSVLLAMRPMVLLTCHNVSFLSAWSVLELPGPVFLPWHIHGFGHGNKGLGMLRKQALSW